MNAKILAAAMFLAASWVSAQSGSLTDLMDATGLKYKITKNGNAMTTYTLDGGRTQAVYVSKRQYQVGGLNLREIWSNAGNVAADSEADVLQKLLTEGGDENLGAWLMEKNDDDWLVYYSAKLPDLSAADLKSVMRYIAAVADAKEQELNGADSDEN
jgi:hypothetical protein